MPDLLNLMLRIPAALSTEACDAIVHAFGADPQQHNAYRESSLHAVSGQRVESTFSAVSLTPGSAMFVCVHEATSVAIARWLHHLQAQGRFNTRLLRNRLRYSHDYRVLRYAPGASIHPHTDWDEFTLASCTLALNDDFRGGELRFFQGEHLAELRKGDALIWPADCFWVHEVTPVESGTRYSVNSFITSIPESEKAQIASRLNALAPQAWQTPYRHT